MPEQGKAGCPTLRLLALPGRSQLQREPSQRGPEGFQRQDLSPSPLPPLLLDPSLHAFPTPLNLLSLCSLGAWSCRASPALCFAVGAGTHRTPGCNLTTGWATASSLPSQSSFLGPLSPRCAKPLPPLHLLASSQTSLPSPLSPPHRILAAPLLSASPLLQPPSPTRLHRASLS